MNQRYNNHIVSRLTVHIVWITKYRYKVLQGDIKTRVRELIIQVAEVEDVKILSGVVSSDHIHMHIEYSPKLALPDFVKQARGRTSRLLQKEFPELSKKYWGKHFLGNRIWCMEHG